MSSDLLVAISAGLGVLGIVGAMKKAVDRAEARRIRGRLGESSASQDPERKSWFEPLGDRLSSQPLGATLEAYASVKHPTLGFTDFMTWMLVGALAGGMVGSMMLGGGPLTVLGVAAGPVVADRLLARSGGRRATRVEHQLPGAITVQVAALRGGRSLTQSLAEVARQTSGPLGEEVSRTIGQVNLGGSISEALDELRGRAGSRDVDLWVTAMEVHRRTGGNLIPLLDGLSEKLRDRLRLRSEVRSLTAQGRLSGIVVAAAPLAFLGILSVTASEQLAILFTTPVGLGVLVAALALEAIGFLWIRRLLRVRL
jgi:tight adherence protein B